MWCLKHPAPTLCCFYGGTIGTHWLFRIRLAIPGIDWTERVGVATDWRMTTMRLSAGPFVWTPLLLSYAPWVSTRTSDGHGSLHPLSSRVVHADLP